MYLKKKFNFEIALALCGISNMMGSGGIVIIDSMGSLKPINFKMRVLEKVYKLDVIFFFH